MSDNTVTITNTEPVSILDRDTPRPIVVEPDDSPDIILPLIVLIVFIAFVGWILFLLIGSGFQATSPSDPVASDNRSNFTIQCAPGQCATDLQSGFKSCPTGDQVISVNPAQAVCNSPTVCDNLLTPFALQSDGSTNINGVCEQNSQCPCLRVSQCPEYVLSIFTANNGSPYQSLPGQRITFPQESTYINLNGQATTVPPIQYNNPATTFCAAPLSWLPLSTPGCNFVSAANANVMDYDDLLICMGMINGCDGFTGSPCLQGTLAFLSPNPDDVNQNNIDTTQLACVSGEPCPCGTVAIFDTSFGGIVCRQLQ
ncbi:Hypothetical protein HVR_LOCUS1359 [uncultured virus]|nr:Hypothetical protein HVR_LOCUS1359 [uncultured virus]